MAWNPEEATSESDGLPDIAIVPYIEALNDQGIETYQSCAGHIDEDGIQSDGYLWFEADNFDPYEALEMEEIYEVKRQYGAEECWIVWFHGMNLGQEYLEASMEALFKVLGVDLPCSE